MKNQPAFVLSLALLILTPLQVLRAGSIANETRPRPESQDGYSVDTATGAFFEAVNLVHLQGSRSLGFDLVYNSLLTRSLGEIGYGWTHQYEGRIVGDPRGFVSVYLNNNTRNDYLFVGEGQPYKPLNESNRYEVLERSTNQGTHVWSLRFMSGTTFLFVGADQAGVQSLLAAVRDHNFNTIDVEREGGKVSKVKEASGLGIAFSYDTTGLMHTVFDGLSYTYLKYDGSGRLSRIYDPYKASLFGVVGQNTTPAPIPFVTPVDYSITVANLVKNTGRMIMLRGSVTIGNPDTMRVFLISPSGTSVPVKITDGYFFSDAFMDENVTGVWKVRILNDSLANPGQTGTINSFQILASLQDPNWTQYEYDAFPGNHIVRASDSQGQRYYTNTYDSQGRIAFQDDGRDSPGSGAWEFRYEARPGGELLTTVFDRTPAKQATRYLHDGNFHLKSVVDALGAETRYAYSTAGDRISITDARGNTVAFGYDLKGNLISMIEPRGRRTSFEYDDRGNLAKVTDALNLTTTFEYDDRNILITATNADAEIQTQIVDGSGKMTGSINKGGEAMIYSYANATVSAIGALGKAEVEYGRDAQGRITSITDPVGHVSTVTYDARGNIVRKTNALDHTNTYVFDHRNRLVSETDERGGVSTYEYDGNDNVTRIVNPLSEAITFEYDAQDRLTIVTDAAGNRTTTVYDVLGRVVERRNPLGTVASYFYDAVGNIIEELGPNGERVSLVTYNEWNLPVKVEDAFGRSEVYAYDLVGGRTEETNFLGKTTRLERDKMGRVAKVTDPLGRSYRNVFTADDVLEKIVYAGGQETTFTYNDTNQVKTITVPGGFKTEFEYNDGGKIAAYIPPNAAKRLEYTYDAGGRRDRRKVLASGVPDTVYAYDAAGNVTSIGTQSGGDPVVRRISRTYDALGRETSNTDALGDRIERTYNRAGLVSRIDYPDGKRVSYTYDAAKRMRTITDWAGRVTEYSYNANDDITGIAFPNRTSRVITYDATQRVVSRTDYDADGGRIVSYRYSYDALGQISTRELPGEPEVFNPSVKNFSYDISNRLTETDGVTVNHDLDGNITRGVASGQPLIMGWDTYGNLSSAGATDFSYDVEDRMIGWQNGGESVQFSTLSAGNSSNIMVSRSSSGGITRYVYGVGLAYEEVDGQIRVLHYDERGNTVALSNASGQVSGTLVYSPYGEVINVGGQTDTIFQYGGLFGVVTAPNGLINMRFRWYSPEMKRFLSLDSRLGVITSPLSLNGYIYAGSNPINFNDPLGEWFGVDDLVAVGVGFVAGVVGESLSALVNGQTPDWRDVIAAGVGGGLANWGTLYGPAGMIAAGAIGGAADYLIRTGLRDAFPMDGDDPTLAQFNWTSLGVNSAIGLGGGWAGAKIAGAAKKTAEREVKKKLLQSAFMGAAGAGKAGARRGAILVSSDQISKGVAEALARKTAERFTKKGIALEFIKLVALETGARQFKAGRVGYPVVLWAKGGPPGGNDDKKTADLSLPSAYVGKGGEYQHIGKYKAALGAANRPSPDTQSRLSPF